MRSSRFVLGACSSAMCLAIWLICLGGTGMAATLQSSSGAGATPALPFSPTQRMEQAVVPGAALAAADDVITFDGFLTDTQITDQYLDRGVLFSGGSVFVTDDNAQPTSPVLSGTPKFFGDIAFAFTVPGTFTPATVSGFSVDVGYINDRNSTEVVYFDASGGRLGAVLTNGFGINHVQVTENGIARVLVHTISEEVAGFSIDNLSIQRSAAGIRPTRMASLGDSYSSGEGLLPEPGLAYDCGTNLPFGRYREGTTATTLPLWLKSSCLTETGSHKKPGNLLRRRIVLYENTCHRHGRAYPNQVRERLGIPAAQGLFVACSGAVTANLGVKLIDPARAVPQYPMSPPGVAGGKTQYATMLDFTVGGGSPDFITVGVGGNDAGFPTIVRHCLIGNCLDDQKSFEATVDATVYPNLVETFGGLRDAFPNATIAAFGYPGIFDPSRSCSDQGLGPFRISGEEVTWAENSALPYLNLAVAEAAAESGVTFVDITEVTKGHELCTADPWINGRRGLSSESFHPTQKAHDAIAKFFIDHYTDGAGRLTFTNPAPSASIRPPEQPITIHFGSVDAQAGTPCGVQCLQPAVCVQGCRIHLSGQGFAPGSQLQVTIHSDPINLGVVSVDQFGRLSADVSVPQALEIGTHVVEVTGALPDGTSQLAVSLLDVTPEPKIRTTVRVRAPARVGLRRAFNVTARVTAAFGTPKGRCVLERRSGRQWRPLARAAVSRRHTCTMRTRLARLGPIRVRVRFVGGKRYLKSASQTRSISVVPT